MKLDLTRVPFSRRGSWMSLLCPPADDAQPLGPGLYLRAHHSRPLARRELFLLEFLGDDKALPFEIDASPTEVILTAGSFFAKIWFDARDTIRLTSNTVVRFRSAFAGSADRKSAAHFSACFERPGLVTVNARPSLRRYAFEALRGSVELDAPWDGEMVQRADVTARPPADGVLDLCIDEFWSTWVPGERLSAEVSNAKVSTEFHDFLATLPAVPTSRQVTASLAAYLLWASTMGPSGLLKREVTFMSLNWMDQIWSWDNCFNMAALAGLDEELAMDQLLVFADHQDEHGAYPDGVTDGFLHSNFSKPPVQSILLSWIQQHRPGFLTPEREEACYQTVARFTEWWLQHRRFAGQELCHGYHGNDLGWDNGSMMHRGAPLITPDLNAFLVLQCEWLGGVCQKNSQLEEAERWLGYANQLADALVQTLWDGKQFGSLHIPTGELVCTPSHASLLPSLLGDRLPPDVQSGLMTQFDRLITPHGVASEAIDSPFYEPEGYWRGPIWPPVVMLAVMGLEKLGEGAKARQVAQAFCQMCVDGGFAENFHAETGEPLVDPAYTWGASVFLCLTEVYGGLPSGSGPA